MKKRNMLKKITALILAVTMLIPTNIYADDNYYYYDEIKPTDDPNVFIDNYGNLKNISDLEIYYNHPHWTKIKEKGKGINDYFETIPATTERDGVVRVSCDFCDARYLRIPRIKTVKNRNAKYTWEEMVMAIYDQDGNGTPLEIPYTFLCNNTYIIDTNGNKIKPIWAYECEQGTPNKNLKRKFDTNSYRNLYKYRYDLFVGKISYFITDGYDLYEPIECSYTVTPQNCYINYLAAYKNSIRINGEDYTKNKKYANNLKKYKNGAYGRFYDSSFVGLLRDGSEFQYSTDKTFKNKKVTKIISASETKMDEYRNCIIEKLKSNTTYYFRLRNYKIVDGVKYYSSWSPARSIRTLKTNSKSPNCKNFKNPGWNPDPYAYFK